MTTNNYLPQFQLDRLADDVAMKLKHFPRLYKYPTIWDGIVEQCVIVEDEPRKIHSVIVDEKRSGTNQMADTGYDNVYSYCARLTRVFILLYYKHHDDPLYQAIVFPALRKNMGFYSPDIFYQDVIIKRIDEMVEQDKLVEQAMAQKAAAGSIAGPVAAGQTAAELQQQWQEMAAKADEQAAQIARLEDENRSLKAQAVGADSTALRELLMPIFFSNENDVKEFLQRVSGIEDAAVTDLVRQWVDDERKISSKSCNRDLWRILHAFKIYQKTESNWNAAMIKSRK